MGACSSGDHARPTIFGWCLSTYVCLFRSSFARGVVQALLAVPISRIRGSSDVLPALGVSRIHYLRAMPEDDLLNQFLAEPLVNGPERNNMR
jgi:hypothetical protein